MGKLSVGELSVGELFGHGFFGQIVFLDTFFMGEMTIKKDDLFVPVILLATTAQG